nr:probable insulin-like peptide 2 [Onthophagus taurus]
MGLKLFLILSIVFTVGLAEKRYKACGQALVDLVNCVCESTNPIFPSRNIRSIDDNGYIKNMEEAYPVENNIMTDHSANKYNSMVHYRQRRDIVDECCKQTCTREQVEEYCLVVSTREC